MMERDDAVFVREVVRIYRRYAVEVVERFGFCPWAERARAEDRVRERVILDAEPDPATVLELVDRLAARPRLEIGLLIVPRFAGDRAAFEAFAAALRALHEEDRGRGEEVFAMAAFHPQAAADLSDPDRLVPFIRRSPDPTIQLVRFTVLDRVRRGQGDTVVFDPATMSAAEMLESEPHEPVSRRVARMNHATVSLDRAAVEAVLEDIELDRARTYARFVS